MYRLLDPEYQITKQRMLRPSPATILQDQERPAYNSVDPKDYPPVPLGPRTMDIKGQVFGKLTVIHHVGKTQDRHQHARWLCRCTCDHHVVTLANNLQKGSTTSCGCSVADSPKYRQKRGPESKHPLYQTWADLRNRLGTPAPFGRTNDVCSRWMNSLTAFVKDIGQAPSPSHRYDRTNKKKPHGPGNWQWLKLEGRSYRQRAHNRLIEFQGERLTLNEWSIRTGLHRYTISNRIDRYGWSIEKALTTAPLKTNSNRGETNPQ